MKHKFLSLLLVLLLVAGNSVIAGDSLSFKGITYPTTSVKSRHSSFAEDIPYLKYVQPDGTTISNVEWIEPVKNVLAYINRASKRKVYIRFVEGSIRNDKTKRVFDPKGSKKIYHPLTIALQESVPKLEETLIILIGIRSKPLYEIIDYEIYPYSPNKGRL